MDKRDLIAVPVLFLLAVVLTVMRRHWNWNEDELFLAYAVGMVITFPLLWHFDSSRFRRRSKRHEHL